MGYGHFILIFFFKKMLDRQKCLPERQKCLSVRQKCLPGFAWQAKVPVSEIGFATALTHFLQAC